jgi:hypothetical protein
MALLHVAPPMHLAREGHLAERENRDIGVVGEVSQ